MTRYDQWKTRSDLDDAMHSRDEALARVEENSGEWFPMALAHIETVQPGWRGTGEDMRQIVTEAIGGPHHPNAWGSLIRQAVKRHWLARTGQHTKMRGEKSNGRETPVYYRTEWR